MSRTPVYRTQLVRESFVYTLETISGMECAGRVAIELTKDSPVELFIVIALDTQLKVIGSSVITQGTLDASLVHPREVFRFAILCNASAIIIAHNHPSGETSHSREDVAVYHRLKYSGSILGIRVLDSIICNHETYHSMEQHS